MNINNKFLNKKYIRPYLLLFPSFILISVFKVYPIIYSVIGSFFKRGKGGITSFCYLDNYITLIKDSTFINSVLVTLKFNILIIPFQVICAVALALFINKNNRGVRIARTLIYIPVAVNMVIASTIWNMILNPSSGPVNVILNVFGIEKQPFLTSAHQALYVIIFICSWKGISYWMMFLLAGIQNISSSIYEAGKIDGTTFFSELFKITLPMLKNSLVFVIISNTMINLFVFVPIYMLTKGGPESSTDTLMYQAYCSAFKYSNYGRSYAIVTLMLIITFCIVGIQFLILNDKEDKVKSSRRLQNGQKR